MSWIQDLLQRLSADRAIEAANHLPTGTATLALPSWMTLHDIEKYQDHRRRIRATVTAHSLRDFVDYCTAHFEEGATAFVSPTSLAADCVLDLGRVAHPGHCDHIAKLQMPLSPEWQAFLQITKDPVSQQELAEWIEDWAPNISLHSTTDDWDIAEVTIGRAVRAIRSITVKAAADAEATVGKLSASQSTFEQVSASSKAGEIPTLLRFRCRPHSDLDERTLEARIGVLTGEKAPRLRVRAIAYDKRLEEITTELASKVRYGLPPTVATVIGAFKAGS